MQRALSAHRWPADYPVRVRMGIHSGEAAQTPVGLVGLEVHRAARIAAVAHGGQIVLSAAAAALLSDSLPAGASVRDLGLHRLKDLGRPERLFQLDADGLRHGIPAADVPGQPEAAQQPASAGVELHRPRHPARRGPPSARRITPGHTHRSGRRWQDPAGTAGRGWAGGRVR